MENLEYQATIQRILDWMSITINDLKQCLYSPEKDRLKKAESELKEMLVAPLPLIRRVVAQEEKNELDKKLLMLVPSLQKLAQAMEALLARTKIKCDSAILFTEKGLGELSQVMSSVGELTRDTKDALVTGNPRLKSYVRTEMERITKMADDFADEHQQRLTVGACTPQASYLYVDMMDGLKKIARELAYLSEKG